MGRKMNRHHSHKLTSRGLKIAIPYKGEYQQKAQRLGHQLAAPLAIECLLAGIRPNIQHRGPYHPPAPVVDTPRMLEQKRSELSVSISNLRPCKTFQPAKVTKRSGFGQLGVIPGRYPFAFEDMFMYERALPIFFLCKK